MKSVESILKKWGAGSILRLGDEEVLFVSVIPTGSFALDLALGVGGFPRGRITEVYGPELSGKTTLCLHAIAECQKMGDQAAIVDAEHALDREWAHTCGVNVDDLYVSQPEYGEQALDIVELLLPDFGLIVVDSVAALVPKAELEGEVGDGCFRTGGLELTLQYPVRPGKTIMGVRPEFIWVGEEGILMGEVVMNEYMGACRIVHLETTCGRLVMRGEANGSLALGERVGLGFDQHHVRFFDSSTGQGL